MRCAPAERGTGMADVDYDDWGDAPDPARTGRVANIANMAGAVLSVALIVGLAVWGYKLAVRDVTGIPVVRALEGPARMVPADPGGKTAAYQGLEVNSVAADGEAAAPADRVVLAPRPVELNEADQPVAQAIAETIGQVLTDDPEAEGAEQARLSEELPEGAVADAAEREAASRMADELGEGATPLGGMIRPMPKPSRVAEETAVPAATDDAEVDAAIADVMASLAPEQTAALAVEVDAATVPAGTRLVQLGAFDDADAARAEWNRLAAVEILAPLMQGKSRVIQEAESGGRSFYRLRALGFTDVDDARAFCSAFIAESVSCIPVQIR